MNNQIELIDLDQPNSFNDLNIIQREIHVLEKELGRETKDKQGGTRKRIQIASARKKTTVTRKR